MSTKSTKSKGSAMRNLIRREALFAWGITGVAFAVAPLVSHAGFNSLEVLRVAVFGV